MPCSSRKDRLPGWVDRPRGFRGVGIDVRMDLLPDAKVGEWILAHAGFAIQRMMPDEALSTLEVIDEAFALAEGTPGEASLRPGNAGTDSRGRSGGDE